MTPPTQQADDLVERLRVSRNHNGDFIYSDGMKGCVVASTGSAAWYAINHMLDLIKQQAARIGELEAERAEVLEGLRLVAAIKNVGMEPVAWIDKHCCPVPAGHSCTAYGGPDREYRHAVYTAAQLAKVQEELDTAIDERIAAGKRIDDLEAQIALAREALEKIAGMPYESFGVVAARTTAHMALDTITAGNAVQQVEARALMSAAEHCDYMRYASNQECAEALRKLAEQKEQETISPSIG